MIKRLFVFVLLITLLSSCNGRAATQLAMPTFTATQASTETQAQTETQAPAQNTETPIATETLATTLPQITATGETPRPTNVPDCTNSASFVADITIPDNTAIPVGTPFTKTWRISNVGTCIWGSDYTLTYYSEERLGAPNSVPLPVTFPGQTADISINLTAPNSTGKHRGNFVVKNPAGLIMKIGDESRLWLIIDVTSETTNATAVPGSDTGLVTSTCAFTSEISNISETIDAINAYRAENGLPPYNVNSLLSKAAQSHANDMACNNLFGHTGSNGSTIQSRVTDAGYVYSSVTENVYGSYPPLSGGGVVNWWKNDKTDLRHNLNLISDTFVDVGVGYSFFNNYGYYVVLFGTP
ncbi:MAG TPA: CAP domain-containing protein [Anaerolineales bacterium]|nr:CAP domain-containing protein [Anaerolineales bacterium]